MRIISIDVGIKNLAYCILEQDDTKMNYRVIHWDVINLCGEVPLCNCSLKPKVVKGKKKQTGLEDNKNATITTCNKKATYMKVIDVSNSNSNTNNNYYNSSQSVEDFVEGKIYKNSSLGATLKYGYITSLGTYGITLRTSEGSVAYAINCTQQNSSDNQFMKLTFCLNITTGSEFGELSVYKDRMIWNAGGEYNTFYLEN